MSCLFCCCLRSGAPPEDADQKATKKAATANKKEEIEIPRKDDECHFRETCNARKDERRDATIESDSQLSLERSDFRSNYREPLSQRVLNAVNEARSFAELCPLQLDRHLQAVADREWLTASQLNRLSGFKGSGGCAYVYFPGNHINCDCPGKKHGALAFRSLRGHDFRSEGQMGLLVNDVMQYWMEDIKYLLEGAVESPEHKQYLECHNLFRKMLLDNLGSTGVCGIHVDMIEESAGERMAGSIQANSICIVLLLERGNRGPIDHQGIESEANEEKKKG